MVPQFIDDWDYPAIEVLCQAGEAEGERHDFKYDLRSLKDPTKLACAFANSFGGFIVMGIKEPNRGDPWRIEGHPPDVELYGNLTAKIKAEPSIAIRRPKRVAIQDSPNVLYVIEVPQSFRRPHMALEMADESDPARIIKRHAFWKRDGSDCKLMSVEEVRAQMLNYEEKRDKLVLLLIDLRSKYKAFEWELGGMSGYDHAIMFSFEIMDRVIADVFSLLKGDVYFIVQLDKLRRSLSILNYAKQRLIADMTLHAGGITLNARELYKRALEGERFTVESCVKEISMYLEKKFAITFPPPN